MSSSAHAHDGNNTAMLNTLNLLSTLHLLRDFTIRYVFDRKNNDSSGQNVIRTTDRMRIIRNGNVAEYTCMIDFSKR